jgi:GNAT-family acetyltransferase (TIGR03103 family)
LIMRLDPTTQLIINEALSAGVTVKMLDEEHGYYSLTSGKRTVKCKGSLTEKTTAIAMSRCQNKRVMRHLLLNSDLLVPDQQEVKTEKSNLRFLERHNKIVVKPACGQRDIGIRVGIQTESDMDSAISTAERLQDTVLLEEYVDGKNLAVLVIDYQVVAATVSEPPEIIGTGKHSILQLIRSKNRRLMKASGGTRFVPIDLETECCIKQSGHEFRSILDKGCKLRVRNSANIYTGGVITENVQHLNPLLNDVAEIAARLIDIPVVSIEFIVPDSQSERFVFLEANEKPALDVYAESAAADILLDFLFPGLRRFKNNLQPENENGGAL